MNNIGTNTTSDTTHQSKDPEMRSIKAIENFDGALSRIAQLEQAIEMHRSKQQGTCLATVADLNLWKVIAS